MKKTRHFIVLILTVAFVTVAFTPVINKTLIKSVYNVSTDKTIYLDLNNEIEIKEWNNDFIRINTNITYENGSIGLMKYLITKGRYNLNIDETESQLNVAASTRSEVKLNKEGTIDLKEKITYTIFVPQYSDVKIVTQEPLMAISDKN